MWIVLLVVVLFSGCTKNESTDTAENSGEYNVATVGDYSLTASDLESFLINRPISRYAKNREVILKERLDELVSEELIYQAALKDNLDKDPDVRKKMRKLLNQEFLKKKINQAILKEEIDQDELRAYYDVHINEFNRPAQVRLADIFIALPKDASNEKKSELKQKAEGVLAEIMNMKNKKDGFPQMIRKVSDVPQTHRRGDTGFFDNKGKPIGIDPELVEVAFAIEQTGNVAEQIVEASDGYHIIMQTAKRSAFNRPFEQVSGYLERRIRNEKTKNNIDKHLGQLKAQTEIVVHEKELETFQVNLVR